MSEQMQVPGWCSYEDTHLVPSSHRDEWALDQLAQKDIKDMRAMVLWTESGDSLVLTLFDKEGRPIEQYDCGIRRCRVLPVHGV